MAGSSCLLVGGPPERAGTPRLSRSAVARVRRVQKAACVVLEQSACPVSGFQPWGSLQRYWHLGPSGVLPGWDGVGGCLELFGFSLKREK